MEAKKILDLIEERRDIALHNEQKFNQQYLRAEDDVQRQAAVNAVQLATAQRLVLQNILDEANETSE